ncbi:MAG: OsmC family peroxiredoxin [Chloroflexi bacterium]|nr:MAG: OsmC family peroxiredoxin [Chloroflexota bacterium]
MVEIKRTGEGVWNGGLRGGTGQVSSASGVLSDTPYSFGTRFEQEPGTNPEELIAAAHAACYSMAFAATLERQGYQPQQIRTRAICSLTPQETGGFKITKMRLETRGRVEGLDEATFKRIAQEAEAGCPVSNALRGSLEIELDAALM